MSDNNDYRTKYDIYWDWPEIYPLIWLTFRKSNWEYEPKKKSDNNMLEPNAPANLPDIENVEWNYD